MVKKLQRIIADLAEVGPGMGDRFGLLPGDFLYHT
jgi:hypothetical protein